MECDSKLEAPGSPDRDGGMDKETGPDGGVEGTGDCDVPKGADETDDGKKRKRKPYRPGDCVAPLILLLCHVLITAKGYVNTEGLAL